MSEAPAIPAKPSEGVPEPENFWELIEKLLQHSSHDEQKRLRHNVSLSALCRGHALSKLTRDKTPQITKSTFTSKDHTNSKMSKVLQNTKQKELSSGWKLALRRNKNHDTNAQQTRSECNLSDSDVVYVKDSEIPASERLWRFAIRNRQHQQEDEASKDDHKPIPSVRSNEAIYEGLRRRLEDAKTEDNTVIKPKQKLKRQMKKVKKHHCENKTNNFGFASSKIENKDSKSIPNTTVSLARNPKPSMPKQQTKSRPIAHDLNRTPVKNLIESGEMVYSYVTPEHFETKRSLYDSVLKKRLTCGNRLQMINREIVDKNMNPRTVLSRETTKKYTELKSDYLKLCYQESSLRHEIAVLHAEIYMMQNKKIHKRPAAVKTITLDSNFSQLPQTADTCDTKNNRNDFEKVVPLPRLKPPKPLILAQQKHRYYVNDQSMQARKPVQTKEMSFSTQKAAPSKKGSSTSFPRLVQKMSPKSVCALYSLTASLQAPPKRQPNALLVPDTDEIQTAHRLPKINIPVNTHL